MNLVKKVITKVKKMSNNAGKCKIVKFTPYENIPEDLDNFASFYFEVVSIDYTAEGKEQLSGYLRQDETEENMLAAAEQSQVKLPPYKIEIIESEDWLTENVIKFAPVEEGDFCVYGIHENNVDTHGKLGIRVYAATAFGSEHQTTRGCLRAISEINKIAGKQKNILDIGTGSGVLALAALKLWKSAEAVAVDIDKEAVIVARQNAEDNGLSERMTVLEGDGCRLKKILEKSPYDVIFANILARPLIAMAENIAVYLKKGGYAVISGFVGNQHDWVVDEYKKYGLEQIKVYNIDSWHIALLEKK